MDALFSYGAYAGYIWFSYGVSALALGGLTVFILRAHANAKARTRKLDDAELS